MKELYLQINQVASNHFPHLKLDLEENIFQNSRYKLHLDKRLNVTGITIFPSVIRKVIRQNFTIFERLYYGQKLEDTAVMVLFSTIFNLTRSRVCIEALASHTRTEIKTEAVHEDLRYELELTLQRLKDRVIPYQDRNKYIIQPNITVNTESKLAIIFSNIELNSFMNVIGYRPEKSKEGKMSFC